MDTVVGTGYGALVLPLCIRILIQRSTSKTPAVLKMGEDISVASQCNDTAERNFVGRNVRRAFLSCQHHLASALLNPLLILSEPPCGIAFFSPLREVKDEEVL